MKTKIFFLISLLCLSTFSAMGQGTITRNKPKPTPKSQPSVQAEEAGYDVTFTCNVPSAALYIDGSVNGNASGSRFLKTGSHTIKVTANGYEEYTSRITVNRAHRTCSISLMKKKGGDKTINVENEEDEIFVIVETDPEYPGGFEALYAYLSQNIHYPQEAKENNITGKVIVRFVVENDGSISNVECIRDIGGGCGAEAVRVVQNMPRWKPGMQRGHPVRARFNLPVSFMIQ